MGEWLTYTISVPKAGNYDVAVRYTAREEGAIQLGFKDGAKTGSIVLPSTGGTNWVTKVIGQDLALEQGVQQMIVAVADGKSAYVLDSLTIQAAGAAE